MTFEPGYGLAPNFGAPPSAIDAQLTLAPTATAAVLPGIATRSFLNATSTGVGSLVHTDINGAIFSVKIVAAVSTFPTVSAGAGGLIVDLGSVQSLLTSNSLQPATATQWWLATTGAGVPPGLGASLPPGSAVTSEAGVAAGLLGNPLSTVPQQALLAVALAAAVLAITGFCVSIAAGVRQRRAENALLAALGVPPRSAAWQLCLEKLMLSLPSAVAGLILGAVLAELLVPAITLTSVGDRAGAAGAHRVRLGGDPPAGRGRRRAAGAGRGPDHRAAARCRRRTARGGGGMSPGTRAVRAACG